MFVAVGMAGMAQLPGHYFFSGADAYKFYKSYYTVGDNEIKIYNWDMSLYGTINLTVPSGYNVSSVSCLSKRFLNNDDNLEMCVTLTNSSNTGNTHSKLWRIDENGNVLTDYGDAYMWSSSLCSYNGESNLVVVKTTIDASYQVSYTTNVYDYGGRLSATMPQPGQSEVGSVYPNPAVNYIRIPYQLNGKSTSEINIYDASGRHVKTIQVGSDFNEVKLDISGFTKGVYLYECEGKTDRFIVQ